VIIRVERLAYIEDGEIRIVDNAQIEIDERGHLTGVGRATSLKYSKRFRVVIPQFVNAHIHVLDLDLREYFRKMYIDDVVGVPYGVKYLYLREVEPGKVMKSARYALDIMYRTGTGEAWIVVEYGPKFIRCLSEIFDSYPIHVVPFLEPSIHHLGPWEETSEELIREVYEIASSGYNVELISPLNYSIDELKKIEDIVHSRNLEIMTHVSETSDTYLDGDLALALNILKADVLVHCTHVEDVQVLRGKCVVVTPRSNLMLVGKINTRLFENGIKIRVGTDNVGLVDPDMWSEARILARLGIDVQAIWRALFLDLYEMDVARLQIVCGAGFRWKERKFLREVLWRGRTLGRIDGSRVCMFH